MSAATIMNQQTQRSLDDEEVPDGESLTTASLWHTKPYYFSLFMFTLNELVGLPASRLFGQGITYTYDDVIFHPGHIDFGAHEVGQLPL